MIKVLFVCMGNICRSPMAEGAFRSAVSAAGLQDRFHIDSAGTIGFHAGNPPDRRAIHTAQKNGIQINNQRSRKVMPDDFRVFDYILAMDHENLDDLLDRAPTEHQQKISLFLPYAPQLSMSEMPDPYYGADNQFDLCFRAATIAAEELLHHISAQHNLPISI
ncbi:protein-tyrosine-phosphatase [Kordiimonas sediminis]|uniref:protein-tyrosine-phosphatase n=1 Tax=Kordiimonas sediminis TaxID=1735581 RepID=A0A919E4F9_9PROT|nr:low molecular weight protein-tyrosine-phosphatase [Kordiimonas sediminis]GHF12027.1 protein-tyrosine-phosphatase [Kordiimonas sediminis]